MAAEIPDAHHARRALPFWDRAGETVAIGYPIEESPDSTGHDAG